MSLARLGVLGGTFSPPTNAHMALAAVARCQHNLDKVLLVPCSVPTLGKNEKPVEAHHRFNMTSLAAAGIDYFVVSDRELKKEPVYSVQTLRGLIREFPDAELFFIAGADTLSKIGSWYKPQEIVKLTRFIVVPRFGCETGEAVESLKEMGAVDECIHILNFPRLDVSSSLIREMIRKGCDCNYLVPDPVLRYIRLNKLFMED